MLLSVNERHPLTPEEVPDDRLRLWIRTRELSEKQNALKNSFENHGLRHEFKIESVKRELEKCQKMIKEKIRAAFEAECCDEEENPFQYDHSFLSEEEKTLVAEARRRLNECYREEKMDMDNFFEDRELIQRTELLHSDGKWENFLRLIGQIPRLGPQTIRSRHRKVSDPLIVRWEIEQLNAYGNFIYKNPKMAPDVPPKKERESRDPHFAELNRIAQAINIRSEYLKKDTARTLESHGEEATEETTKRAMEIMERQDLHSIRELEKEQEVSISKVLHGIAQWIGSFLKRTPTKSRRSSNRTNEKS